MDNLQGHTVGKSYAAAIFELAEDRECLDIVSQELQSLADAVGAEQEFKIFFHNPCISYNQKQKILDDIFSDKLNRLTLDFASVVLKNGKMAFLEDIKQCLDRLIDEKKGLRFIEIILPGNIDAQKKADIVNRIEQACGCRVKAEFVINPEIIGGIIIRQNDVIIDNSIKTALDSAAGIIRNKI